MNYYTYILKCSDNSYYTGITNNLEKRIAEHQEGLNPTCYTFNKRPIELVYHQNFLNPEEAIQWEKRIKGWSRKKKEALINGDWTELERLSNLKNHSSINSE